jgi:membrane fusion protein (multidrug efflux system)
VTEVRQLFRRAALERQAAAAPAALLRVSPRATAWLHGLVCAGLLAALLFVSLGRVSEYASGPAVVRIDGRTILSASQAAVVSRVEVAPGERVAEGALLVQFYAAPELAELEAAAREFDDQLLKLMQRPQDAAAREALVALRTRRELARARLEQRSLRAPHAGVVGDVRARPGQPVEPGVSLLELRAERAQGEVVALLPGRYRPLLRAGAKLRFELDGFQRRAHELSIAGVGDQIVGPEEAARYLGRDMADAVAISGSLVLVRAALPSAWFEADGEHFQFAPGMLGKAESVVRSEPIAYAFLPGLKQWAQHVW